MRKLLVRSEIIMNYNSAYQTLLGKDTGPSSLGAILELNTALNDVYEFNRHASANGIRLVTTTYPAQ